MKIRSKLSLLLILTLVMTCLLNVQSGAANYNVSVDINTKYQTLEGFGAAIAWYNNWVTGHPNKNELYNVLFYDLGLDILRLRNQYRNNNNFAYDDAEIVKMAKILNPNLKVFLASWSPPENLKRDGVMNGGTLKKENGSFVYDKFADYWYNSLIAYKEKGIVPDYISIQNEPDYEDQNWETCIFKPTEDQNYPSYGKALDAVYNKIKSLPDMPKILAPEAAGIGFNTVQNYTNNMDLSKVYGIAHHLYNGGDGSNPDSFNSIFKTLAETYPDKPLFQTEYDYGTPFTTAQLIYNSLVIEGVSAYFYWDLIWENSQRPLVFIENPFTPNSWTTQKGYILSDFYYTIQQYAKFTDPGFKRVEANCNSNDVKVTAFVSPDESKLTMIFINTASAQNTVSLDLNGFSFNKSVIYRTLENGNEKFAPAGSLTGNTVTLAARSIVTVALGFDDDATPPPLPTPTPPPSSRSAYELIQAEEYNSMYGISREVISEDGNQNIGYIENGDYACYEGIDFGTGATGFEARVSSNTNGGNIEIRLDGLNTQTVAIIKVPGTGDWNNYIDISADVSGLTGKHDLYLYFSGESGYLFNIDSFRFTGGTVPTPPPAGIIGDVNGDESVDSLDITYLKRYLLRKIKELPVDNVLYVADLDGDEEITSLDLSILKRYVLRKLDKFPKQ